MASGFPLSDTVHGRVPPSYEYRKPQEDEKYEGAIYEPPPFVRYVLGHTRYWLAPRPSYDDTQRRHLPKEIELEAEKLNPLESFRYWLTGKQGIPHKTRNFPWKDQWQRSGWCPETYDKYEWKAPRRTLMNKYIPPPKDGVYEDVLHFKQHFNWASMELNVYRFEYGKVKDAYTYCLLRHPHTHNDICRGVKEVLLNMQTKTNVDKVKMLIWSGVPAIKDGGFKVRY